MVRPRREFTFFDAINEAAAMREKTVLQRLRAVAVELKELQPLIPGIEDGPPLSSEAMVMDALLMENYDKAITICDGDYEPPDPPGWEGGFAKDH